MIYNFKILPMNILGGITYRPPPIMSIQINKIIGNIFKGFIVIASNRLAEYTLDFLEDFGAERFVVFGGVENLSLTGFNSVEKLFGLANTSAD